MDYCGARRRSMPAALRVQLTSEERAKVERCYETACDAETRTRYSDRVAGGRRPQRASDCSAGAAQQGYGAARAAPLWGRWRGRRASAAAAGPPAVPAVWEAELRRVIDL